MHLIRRAPGYGGLFERQMFIITCEKEIERSVDKEGHPAEKF
jgi:hypothetical protein